MLYDRPFYLAVSANVDNFKLAVLRLAAAQSAGSVQQVSVCKSRRIRRGTARTNTGIQHAHGVSCTRKYGEFHTVGGRNCDGSSRLTEPLRIEVRTEGRKQQACVVRGCGRKLNGTSVQSVTANMVCQSQRIC